MTDFPGTQRGTSRSRIGPVLAIAIVAFLIGLGLMAYAVRNTPGFFVRSAAPTPAPSPSATPTPPVAATAVSDLNTLALREAALAAQVANLEARVAHTDGDSAQAAARAGRAEAILTAFASRRAIDRGAGLGYLEAQLRERFGTTLPNDVNTVIRAARAPVTLEDLREGLNSAAPVLLSQKSDWWAGIGSELRSLVVIHRAGTPSPLPSDRLARARRMLDMGNVEAALGEVQRLPGAGGADGWIAAARRWIDARRSLDTLEAAAITGAIAPPRVTVLPAMPAPDPSPSAEAETETGAQGLF
ncbi:hypothetical protein [Sphingomonas adhaesiva]|uniref:hypothetical protein n=1 Tax=Sphingomonas adhaesiva TaxID=28212 RepID=UPI002FFA89E3